MLEKTTRMNVLYDIYGELLTEKQQAYMTLYYREDYSLGEIAQLNNVSRQAIYDNIRRTEQVIETYEAKLGLYEKHHQRQDIIHQLQIALDKKELADIQRLLEQLTKID